MSSSESKIYPIRVEPLRKRYTNIVEWELGNTCNFNCSFCPDKYKSGSARFLDLSTYTQAIDKLTIEAAPKKLWVKLTGGEPTLYPKLIELMTYIKSKGHYTYLITNGSRTMRYWQELKDSKCADFIAFTYHAEQTDDVGHTIKTVQLFEDVPTVIAVNVTCVPKYFTESVNAFNRIKSECAAYINLQQVNDELGMTKYTDEQKDILVKSSQTTTDRLSSKTKSDIPQDHAYHSGTVKYIYNNGFVEVDQAISFIKRGKDDFFGYKCEIGMSNIRIEHETVKRAVCDAGETWSVYDEGLFRTEPVICPYHTCTCTLDFIIPKSINR